MNKLLIFCHPRPYINSQTGNPDHWLSKDIEFLKQKYDIGQILTVDTQYGGDYKADAFSDSFIVMNKNKFKVVIIPDCGGLWYWNQDLRAKVYNTIPMEKELHLMTSYEQSLLHTQRSEAYDKISKEDKKDYEQYSYDYFKYLIIKVRDLITEDGIIIYGKFMNEQFLKKLKEDMPELIPYKSIDHPQSTFLQYTKSKGGLISYFYGGKSKKKSKKQSKKKSKKQSKKKLKKTLNKN
jgi:hypothetical protein